MKYNIDKSDYFLISIGILLLPVFGIGLILIGITIYKIGQKLENKLPESEETADANQVKMNKYDKNLLEEMK